MYTCLLSFFATAGLEQSRTVQFADSTEDREPTTEEEPSSLQEKLLKLAGQPIPEKVMNVLVGVIAQALCGTLPLNSPTTQGFASKIF